MLSPRWRKVVRDLWSNKTRTLLVVMSIAIGVFAVGTIASSQIILSGQLSASYRATSPASATLYGPFTEEIVETVRRMDGIADAEGRGGTRVRLQAGPEEWKDLYLTALTDFEDVRIARMGLVEGRWPGEREVVIERASLSSTNAGVGDTVMVELPDGKQRALPIVGVAHDLAMPSAIFNPTVQGYITFDTLEWLTGGRGINDLNIVVAENATDRAHIEAIAAEVKEKVEKGGATVYWTNIPEPGKHWADEIVTPLLLILGVLGSLSLGLSGFLVVNTISALLTQQIRQIGVMKAIGARTGQLVQLYLGAVLIFGVLSLLVAVPLGALGAYGLTNFTSNMLNFYTLPLQIPPQALALEIAVGLLVPIAAALVPIWAGTRVTVQQAISSYGLGQGRFGGSWIDRAVERVRGLPRPLLLSLRNTFRRKARLLLTLSTLILGGAIFIAVLTVHSSLMATLDDSLAYWNYDVGVDFDRVYRIEELEREALRVPGVVAAESWGGNTARRVRANDFEGPEFFLLAPPADTQMLNPTILEGRWLLPEDENAIVLNSDILDEETDVRVGDTITLKIEGRETDWVVVGTTKTSLSGSIAYANYPYFARATRFVGRAGSIQVTGEQHDAASQLQLATALKEHFDSEGMNVSSTETIGSIRSNVVAQFNVLVAFLAIMAVLIAFVGSLGLMGTMSMNVLERSREVGVMRAIGASDGAVLNIFIVEGVIIGLLSWGVGVVLSVPISRVLCEAVGVSFLDAPLTFTFSTMGAGLWLGVILVLAALSSLWPAWRASRLTVRDVLAYE